MKPYLLPIFVLLIVGCGNRNPANIVVENRIRQTEQTDSIIGDSYERDTIQGDFNGDGKIEYAYSESNPAEYYSLDEVDDGKLNNITFSNPTIPAIVHIACFIYLFLLFLYDIYLVTTKIRNKHFSRIRNIQRI